MFKSPKIIRITKKLRIKNNKKDKKKLKDYPLNFPININVNNLTS